MKINPLFATDCYKLDHRRQYPKGTTKVHSNFTARKSRISGIEGVVFFGMRYILTHMNEMWSEGFFSRPKTAVLSEYRRMTDAILGPGVIPLDHISKLHDYGKLPIRIDALPEGTDVPIGVPMFLIENTKPEFFWLTNYLETYLSTMIWKPCTSATLAKKYRVTFNEYAVKTGASLDFCRWQGHDFSMRGLSGINDGALTGAGHSLFFHGTDSVVAIAFLEEYYDGLETFVGGSVPATEHSVMCMGMKESELETYRRLLTEVYPKGIVSIVSDTWDFWRVVTEYMPKLKDIINARKGKLVLRPDSGDPVKIIIGDPGASEEAPRLGLIQCLWNVFGGTVNEKGYKVLNPKVGAIYGDSITLERQQQILFGLEKMGFATDCVVLGIGSYTYQMQTRDTFGGAIKSTYGEVDGTPREIFKDPITDDGTKRSKKGLIKVINVDGVLVAKDRQPSHLWNEYIEASRTDTSIKWGEMSNIYFEGTINSKITLAELRENSGVWDD